MNKNQQITNYLKRNDFYVPNTFFLHLNESLKQLSANCIISQREDTAKGYI